MTYTTQYDALIQQAVRDHFPQIGSWLWAKAQLIAESNLRSDAVSSAGAQGIAQFMPETWDGDVVPGMGLPAHAGPLDVQYAIPAYAWYMRLLWSHWTAPRTAYDRLALTQASYNAGFGNIANAQREARRVSLLLSAPNDYPSIIAALPHVTGVQNARQTTDYVQRIREIYAQLSSAVPSA